MSAPTLTRASAYPLPVDGLLARALDLGIDLGELPSRNRLMAELHIGPAKANTIRQTLSAEPIEWGLAKVLLTDAGDVSTGARAQFTADVLARLTPLADDEPADVEPVPVEPDGRHLHAVPDVDTAPPAPVPDVDTSPDTARDTVAYPGTSPGVEPAPVPDRPTSAPNIAEPFGLVTGAAYPGTNPAPEPVKPVRKVRSWPVLLLALPAFVAIWSGWVGLGTLTGFGMVNLLPGIVADGHWSTINTAITLPIGVETYAAFALRVWLSPNVPVRARRFARLSAIASLAVGAAGQVAYHLMTAAHMVEAHWTITTAVASLPVAVLGMGAALAHLLHEEDK
ncbi:hypothetical protein Lfu02_32510 [Longispora fulva]|uniref:Uncharacterized protein n=1 Tax=Longispora fulva TaxID=619741 RepID=A0A8J7KYI2_9ACTN|nr:ABC transporter permease [Longispora fulva]MBG6139382.1 hypothetical protein [Longispora fulva]GIG58879.1 hypothetical protein Lfu02_32510 [Longispora fulva]